MELTDRQQAIKNWADEQGMSTFEKEDGHRNTLKVKVSTYKYLVVDDSGMISAETTRVLDGGGGEVSIGDKELRIQHENGRDRFHVSEKKFPNFD